MPDVGDFIPPFEVNSADGEIFHFPRDLEEPYLVVVIYRKNTCKPCREQLSYLRDEYAIVQARQAELVALSFPPPAESAATELEMGLPYRLLCDPEARVLELLGALNIEKYHATEQIHSGLVFPTIFLLGQNGEILFKLETKKTATREEFHQIFHTLDTLQ